MSARDDVAAVLARFDDDAWAALANRGLLRRARKDLTTCEVRLLAEDDAVVTVGVDDVVVRLGTTGPGDATCTCPSPVTCRHVLTAGLWLAAGAAAPAGRAVGVGPSAVQDGPTGADRSVGEVGATVRDAPPAVADPADALHDELMALDAATLSAYAGLPGYRWAHQLLDDATGGPDEPTVTRDGYLTVTFPRRGLTVRYLGGGPAALVVDQAVPQLPRVRVAAVLAWQRAHGLVLQAPPSPRSRELPPSATAASRTASRDRLRVVVAAVLRDTVRVGVSHLSPALHERLVTAAVWAQGAEYHRLALLLRRVADEVELLLERSALADDLVLLDDIATAYALVTALTATAGHEPAALVGRARTSYDPVRRLDLVGLGGRPWRTASGYHGLTCVFWDTTARRVLTWTDARPQGVAGFDPRARWGQPGPWAGLPTPACTAGRVVTLTHAQVGPGGRLSGAETTTATTRDVDGADLLTGDGSAGPPVHDVWDDVAPRRPTGLLDDPDTATWAVVRPADALPPRWDAVAQTLRWPLLDARGGHLVLEVPWSRLHAHVVERVEAIGTDLPPGVAVVARVRRSRGRLVGEPLSLVLPGRSPGVDALHFDPGVPADPSVLVTRLLAGGDPDRPTTPADAAGVAPLPGPVAALRGTVGEIAQRGCGGMPPGVVHARLAAAHAAARAIGLTVLPDPDPTADPADLLLRSAYLVQQVERGLG